MRTIENREWKMENSLIGWFIFSIFNYPLSIIHLLMWAVVESGGKQYQVSKGEVLKLEKMSYPEGPNVELGPVLLLSRDEKGKEVLVGAPHVASVKVKGKILKLGRDKKVIVFKYKQKKRYRVKKGHRQNYSLVEITDIEISK